MISLFHIYFLPFRGVASPFWCWLFVFHRLIYLVAICVYVYNFIKNPGPLHLHWLHNSPTGCSPHSEKPRPRKWTQGERGEGRGTSPAAQRPRSLRRVAGYAGGGHLSWTPEDCVHAPHPWGPLPCRLSSPLSPPRRSIPRKDTEPSPSSRKGQCIWLLSVWVQRGDDKTAQFSVSWPFS